MNRTVLRTYLSLMNAALHLYLALLFPICMSASGHAQESATPSRASLPNLEETYAKICEEYADSEHYRLVQGAPLEFDPKATVLEWEGGSGHGGTLELARAEWSEEELTVTRVRYEGSRKPYDSAFPPDLDRRVVERTRLNAALAKSLFVWLAHATTLRLEELERDDRIGWSSTWSSASFHSRLRILVAGEALFEEQYTGYPGSADEPDYVRVRTAAGLLRVALAESTWQECEMTDALKRLIRSHIATFDEESWWVQERLLQLMGRGSDTNILPFLKARIAAKPPARDSSDERRLYHAINAYARLSGVDLRPEPVAEMDVRAVRTLYVKSFRER